MNSFGRLFRVSIYGESHSESVGILIDGVQPGIAIDMNDLQIEIDRRKPLKAGTTGRREPDIPIITSGIFNGCSTGAPININFKNKNVISDSYSDIKNTPRPGHSDFSAYQKFKGYNDYRGGGHFSGRLTLGIVAAGFFAKKMLKDAEFMSGILNTEELNVRLKQAIKNKDSVGAVIECKVSHIPPGLGEPFFDSVESYISHLIFSIPGIKGIEFGAGFKSARMYGSEMNDTITDISGKTETNNSGGINGGITNSNEIVFRVAVKPTASIGSKQSTIDIHTGDKKDIIIEGRHDACFALRVPVIIEAAAAIALADLYLISQSK